MPYDEQSLTESGWLSDSDVSVRRLADADHEEAWRDDGPELETDDVDYTEDSPSSQDFEQDCNPPAAAARPY